MILSSKVKIFILDLFDFNNRAFVSLLEAPKILMFLVKIVFCVS